MASKQQKTQWIVHGTIAMVALIIVLVNFGPNLFSSGQSSQENIDREVLAQQAPTMTDTAFHRNFESEQQCITCHTQQVLNAPLIPHEPRERCIDCHQVAV